MLSWQADGFFNRMNVRGDFGANPNLAVFKTLDECMKLSKNCNNNGSCDSFLSPTTGTTLWKCYCSIDFVGSYCQYDDQSATFWILLSTLSIISIIFVLAFYFLFSCSPSWPLEAFPRTSLIDGKRYDPLDGSRIKDD